MPTVRMLVALAGPTLSLGSGDLYECDDSTAARFVAAGIAQAVPAVAAPSVTHVLETATAPRIETTMHRGAPHRAVKPRGKARG